MQPEDSPAKLNQCIKFLKHPDPRVDPPLTCYKILDFPNEPRDTRIRVGPHYKYFQKLLGSSKLAIADIITINKDKPTISSSMSQQITKRPQRYIIIPLYFPTNKNYYAVLYDKKVKEVEFFIPPGSVKERNDRELELKFRELLIDQLKLPIEFFYYNISNAPKPGTYHADFWPSWLILQKILKATDREQLVDYALENLLRNSDDYKKFTENFTNYIVNSK
jgi:hypothetical protein